MQSFCRTCFLQIPEMLASVSLDYQSHKYQLIFCVPEMNLRAFPDVQLCKECIAALNVTYNFKMKCTEMENQINDTSMITQKFCLDKRTYNVCRTCLVDVKDSSFYLTERTFYKSKLIFCVPELSLRATSDINLCNNCYTVLDKIYTFKGKCLDVEKNIKEYLKLHDKINFRDLSLWCNALVKYEVTSDHEDYAVKQEIDLVNKDEVTEDVKEQITNTTLISHKTEELKTCECTENTLMHQNCKCDNVQHLSNKSKNYSKHTKCVYNTVQKRNLLGNINPEITKIFKCLLCEYSTAHKSSLKQHIRTHTGEKPFKCSLCEYCAADKSTLKRHIRIHTGEKPFKCTLCEYSAAYKTSLKQHICSHTGEKPFKCSLCAYSTTYKSHFKDHVHIHTGEKPFKCLLCEYSTAQKYNLKTHIRIHTGEKPFKCLLCEYSAVDKSSVKRHIRTHTGEKPFKCLICKYSAIDKSSLKRHIRIHTGEKPFKCSMCEYSTADKSHFNDHIRTHTGEKPFKCSLCEYSAAHKSTLRNHVRTHTGEKPFKCTLCEYSAAYTSSLRNHIRTHSGEKPFKCSLCEYSTANKTRLKIHIRTHTVDQ